MALDIHLHLCHKCQVVHATKSVSGPQKCGSCGNHGFSRIAVEELLDDDTDV